MAVVNSCLIVEGAGCIASTEVPDESSVQYAMNALNRQVRQRENGPNLKRHVTQKIDHGALCSARIC